MVDSIRTGRRITADVGKFSKRIQKLISFLYKKNVFFCCSNRICGDAFEGPRPHEVGGR